LDIAPINLSGLKTGTIAICKVQSEVAFSRAGQETHKVEQQEGQPQAVHSQINFDLDEEGAAELEKITCVSCVCAIFLDQKSKIALFLRKGG
jgi:hypothetical protein